MARKLQRSKRVFKTVRAAWKDIAEKTGLKPSQVKSGPHTKGFWQFQAKPRPSRNSSRNPPPGAKVIYPDIHEIWAQKPPDHGGCNPKCEGNGHLYRHEFNRGATIYGLPNGALYIH